MSPKELLELAAWCDGVEYLWRVATALRSYAGLLDALHFLSMNNLEDKLLGYVLLPGTVERVATEHGWPGLEET